MYDRSNEAQRIHCVSPVAANKLGQLTSMHNPSHSGYYDRGPPTHFRNWNEHGYTPPYHYAKQHNGHHVRQYHHHHSNYHYDWHSHHAPPFHRPPFHSSPPSQIIHSNWRHAQPQPVPKIIIQRSSVREEKGKVLRLSGNSKSPPLYHVKPNSLAVSGPSPKDYREINLPQEKKLFSGRKEKKVRKEAIAVNEKFSELSAIKPALNVVISNEVSDKEIKKASPNTSEGISQKDINSDNPSGQQISSADTTVTHSKNGGEIKPIHSNSDICVSKDSLINFSNPLTDRDNSKREDSEDLKRDFSVKDNAKKMEFNVSKSYNMKNCKRNSLVKLKKRYPELQKLFGKDPLIKLRRLTAAKIASYESKKSQESKGHNIGSVSEKKGLELNKENKSIRGISVDPKVMSLSRALQNPLDGKKPVETIFKCTVSRLKSANPSPKSKRDAPKISYKDISKLKMKFKNIEVPRSPNISSKTSHIKSINPEPSSETKKKDSICLDKSSVSSSVSLNEHSQEHTITKFKNKEFNHITAFTSVTNENETEMKTCNSEIARTETDKCNMPGTAPTSSQKNTVSDQTLSESMPALTIRRHDQMKENGQMLTSECTPSPPLLELQVVSECSSLEPVEGQSYASDLGRQVDLQGDSLGDKTIHKLVKEEIMQKKETVRPINSASDLSQSNFQSESFDDREKVDSTDSKTPQSEQGEELKTGFGQRQVSDELHASCIGDKTADINQRDRNLFAPCSKPVISERHKDSISCPPSDLDNSIKGESMKNSVVAMDSTPHSAGEELRTSAANQTVLGSCTNRAPVWQYNCSEEMLIAADTLLSVANLPACGATETVGNENYPMDKSSFYQTEYVTCPEETVGLDLTINSNTTKDNTIVDSVISVGENKSDDVTENCDTGIEADNNLVKRKRLKVGKRENVSNDKVKKHGEEEESQACDSDATYIYSDSGEDSTMNQVVEGVQERGKDGSLPSANSKKLSDLKKDSKSTKHSSNAQKANNGQKKGREKSNYVVKSRAKGSPSELVENNKVSDGAEQKRKRKLSQYNDMVIKRKKASPSLKVVIGKVDSAKVNEGIVNKNADGDNKNDSGKNISESKEIKSKKAKSNKEIPVKENVNARKKKNESMKKASGVKDLNRLSIDKSDKMFPDFVQSGSPEEEAEEIKKSEGISTTAKGTDSVSRKGKRLGGRRGGITRADIFQKNNGPQQSAEEEKARRGKGSRGGRGRGQKTFTRVVKRHGKDLQIHLNEVLHRGEDSDDLPTILPPKRRRRAQHTTSHQSSDKMDRIMAEFPKHNWLITKYQSEPEDLSLCDSKKKEEVQLDDKTAEDHDSTQPLTVQENLGTDQNELERIDLPNQNELERLDLPDQSELERLDLPDQSELERLDLPDQSEHERLDLPDQTEHERLDLPAKHPEPVKENKDDGEVTEEDSFDSPLYIDMDSVNEKEVDEDSPSPKQHPLDLCVKKNDKASVTFRQHSNPPVQLVHPHVHRPPTSGSLGQLSTVSNILLRDTKHALSNVVVSSQSSDITQGIVRKISADWSTSSTGSVITGARGDLISEIIDLGKSIHVPENLLKHGVLPSPLCNDISDMQVLHNSCSEKEDISDKKQESSESEAKFVQPAIPKLIPASSIVPGSIFSPAQLTENHEIVLLPVSFGPSTDIVVPDVDQGQRNISNSQVIQVENAVSMRNDATDISENRNLLTSQERTLKVGGKDEQLYPSTSLCSSAVQITSSSNETNIVSLNDDSTAITKITTISCSSLLPEEHSAPLSSNPDVRIIESTLVASHLSQGSIPATSIGSIKLSAGSGIDICDIKSNSESIGNDISLNTTIPEIPEKETNIEMQPNSSLKYKTPGSECGTVDSSISMHIKSLKTDKHNAVGVIGKDSVNMADSNLDMTEGEPPTKRYCVYPSSLEPLPLMMAQTLVDAESVSPDQNISYLANDNTLHICSPVHNSVVELDPEIQKQIEELDKKIQQNEKEKEEMLNAKKKMAELMERKKREKLEEQVKVISKEEQQPMPIENVPVQTAVGMQDPLNHLPLSDSNHENVKVSNSHEEQPWSKYQSPFNETSCLEQQSAAFQEPASEQQQELPQPHSNEKQTPNQLPVSLYQPPWRQNQQQKQKEQQQEQTTDQLLVHTQSFQQQATPRSQNIHEQQQQNIPYQLQQPSQHQRRSIPQHTILHDKPSPFQQPSSPSQMSQTSQGFVQCPPLTERASSQSLSSAENNLANRIQHQQPTSQQQNHTSLKQMMQIQNSQQQNIQGSNVPRQQLLQQQLFSCQQPNQLAGSQFQQQQVVSQQRFHLQSSLHMQPSQAAQTQSPAHLQHGFQNQYRPPQHPSLTQQQQYSQTQQQNYYNHQTQLQPQQQQFQQNCVKNQTSQTHSISPGHSSVPTVQNMQRPNMQHQHQMQHYQQMRMQQQQQQQQQPRPQLFQARPSNFGNTFQMPSSQQHEMQSVAKQNNSHELQCNLNPLGPKNVSPCSSITGTANVTPTIPRQITLAMQEAQKRKQFGLPEIQPAHCNNEKSLLRRDSEPPPPAHMNCVSLKKLMRKMDRNAIKLTSTIKASCPYLQRNEPITCPPLDAKKSGSNEMKAPAKAHSQPPFNIAGKLIIQQLPGKTPSINRLNNEDKETARHSSVPNTPTSATLGVQLPPRASSASDRHLQKSQSIFETGHSTFTLHPNSPSTASLSRSASSSQSFTNLSIQEESKLTDKGNTPSVVSLNSQQKSEGIVNFTNTSQTLAPPAIQSQDAVATPNIDNTNIIDLTKEFSTVKNLNESQKDATEKAVQLELNKAIAKRCKQDLQNATMAVEDWTQFDQQPSKASLQTPGMKLPLGPSSTIVLTVDNQPHAQQASLQVSPVLVSTPMHGIQNQQQQWQRISEEMNPKKSVLVSPPQKQLPINQGPGLMMRPSSGMQVTAVSNVSTMHTPSNRLSSVQGGRMPYLLPKVQAPMIRMIGSAAVPVQGVLMPPTAGNMEINRLCHPQAVMMQAPYTMNQQHLQAQRQYQNPEIMKHRTRQYIGGQRAGIMPRQQIPLQSSVEMNQDSNSCVQPVQQPPLNPSAQANAFNQNRQQPHQLTPSSQQAFVPMSYQRQTTSSQARFVPLATYVTSSGHGQHMHTQNSMIMGNEQQQPNRPGKTGNTAPQTNPVTSTSQPAQIVSTSPTKTAISTQVMTSIVPSEHPITSQTSNMFPKEVEPTSNKAEAHLQQINGSCVMCGNFSLYLCSCCKKMWYCSPQCQLKHWTSHSLECRESTTT